MYRRLIFVLSLLTLTVTLHAQAPYDPAPVLAAQKEALKQLSYMNGTWRGTAEMINPDGSRHQLTQTERVGDFLGGSVKVIEGRGYEADGSTSFNALAVLSYDPATKLFSLNSHAMGRKGEYRFTPTADGFIWEIPAGPMTIRYTATFKDGKWREVGDRVIPGREPIRFLEMNLVRLGDTNWPAGDAVPVK